MIHVISLGAGVQSTTMALMAAHGELTPMPDCAIFADTQWEPQGVYDHLAWLQSPGVLPFPVHVVTIGSLREHLTGAGKQFTAAPWHVQLPNGDRAIGRRQCTQEYKLKPIRRKVRELLGGKTPKAGCQMLIGISTDEAMRMRPSRIGYIVNRFPLIERRFDRNDCVRWLERRNYHQPPKSSCIGCPLKSNARWRLLRDGAPAEWRDAIAVDMAIRSQGHKQQFMHHSFVPLELADLSTLEDHGQLNLFNNECEGMCGV